MGQRIAVPLFIGGTTQLISGQASTQRTINFYPETVREGGKVKRYSRPAEGIQTHAQFASIDTTSLFSQDGRAFACCGDIYGEFLDGGTSLPKGTIEYDGSPTTQASNGTAGHQNCVVSAGRLYIYNLQTDVFVEIMDFPNNGIEIAQCEFMDGYFLALARDSRRVYYSTLEDGLTWDLTFGYFERSWGSDNIAFIKRSGRVLWVVGTKTSEVYADTGNATQPFAPVQGGFLDIGCIAGFTGQRDSETLQWLSQDERGGGRVVRATGYTPQEISTFSIDAFVERNSNVLRTAEAFVHQIQGHQFYWLHIDGLETTLVYDFAEDTWCERAMWLPNRAVFIPHIARCHCYAFERHFVGVRESGIIYELSPTLLKDGVTD